MQASHHLESSRNLNLEHLHGRQSISMLHTTGLNRENDLDFSEIELFIMNAAGAVNSSYHTLLQRLLYFVESCYLNSCT